MRFICLKLYVKQLRGLWYMASFNMVYKMHSGNVKCSCYLKIIWPDRKIAATSLVRFHKRMSKLLGKEMRLHNLIFIFSRTRRCAGCAMKIMKKMKKMTTRAKNFWQKEGVYKAALKQGCQWIKRCSRYGFYSKQKY